MKTKKSIWVLMGIPLLLILFLLARAGGGGDGSSGGSGKGGGSGDGKSGGTGGGTAIGTWVDAFLSIDWTNAGYFLQSQHNPSGRNNAPLTLGGNNTAPNSNYPAGYPHGSYSYNAQFTVVVTNLDNGSSKTFYPSSPIGTIQIQTPQSSNYNVQVDFIEGCNDVTPINSSALTDRIHWYQKQQYPIYEQNPSMSVGFLEYLNCP